MGADGLVGWLFGFTLLAGLGIALWQYTRVRGAKRSHEGSSLARPEPGPEQR
jgi:hypothetical protein